jgi:hypothetical protein
VKRIFITTIIFSLVSLSIAGQKPVFRTAAEAFFDNLEYSGSQVKASQTMAGVHLAPQLGLQWDERHFLFAGIDLLHEFGSERIVDAAAPLAYYEFRGKPFHFYMGAFPRRETLNRYPRIFFADSINHYRPAVNGFFWEIKKDDATYLNLWLDWTSRQTEIRRETFFMGWSGRYQHRIFYGQHFGYMFHFAGVRHPHSPQGVNDNGLLLTSFGLDFAEKARFELLEINAGWAVALERQRSLGDGWHTPQGLLSEIKVEYGGLGIFNTLYWGNEQRVFRSTMNGSALSGNNLYWGDPIFSASFSNQTDLYIRFIKTQHVDITFKYGLTFAEHHLYHQQLLTASIHLGADRKSPDKPYRFIWDNWLK